MSQNDLNEFCGLLSGMENLSDEALQLLLSELEAVLQDVQVQAPTPSTTGMSVLL